MIMIGHRRRRSARSSSPVVAALVVGVSLLAGGCQQPPAADPSPSESTSSVQPPSSAPTDTPTPDPAEELELQLQKVGGVSDTNTVADANDLDCEPGDADAPRIHLGFTAKDAGAMKQALLTGRDFLAADQSGLGFVCLVGSYPGDRRVVQIDLTNDFAGASDTWPSASMIAALVHSSRQSLDVGSAPLRWIATADISSELELSSGLDTEPPSVARGVPIFTELGRHWTPLSGYDRVTINVPTTSGGFLGASQQDGPVRPWKADVPAGMLTLFSRLMADIGDVRVDRSVTAGKVTDRFDFLYASSDSSLSRKRRQRIAHRVIAAYWALPAEQRGDRFAIRSGPHTELDFDTTSCNGILPGMDHRQDSPQTPALYRWYAAHYPKQAEQGGVDHCV